MPGSTQESRDLVNQAVQERLKVGETVQGDSLKELARAIGLIPTRLIVGTLRSMKFNGHYRREAAFSLRFGNKDSGVPRHDFSLTRTR